MRAVVTFLRAVCAAAAAIPVTLVIADDSADPADSAALRSLLRPVVAAHPEITIAIVQAGGGGPGAARNSALAALRGRAQSATVTMMFDDDMCFADTFYRRRSLRCDGAQLLREALTCCDAKAVVGCPYLGRQDLSILEHARLAVSDAFDPWHVAPALTRGNIENVAPGGISTAFLAIGVSPAALPDFPAHYNEDYVWLQALARAGWPLQRIGIPAIHAPPGDVAITAKGLAYQIHGEIVWLAVLEYARFPVDDDAAMVAAIAEIAGDLQSALREDPALARSPLKAIIAEVLARYDALSQEFIVGRLGDDALRLRADIMAGLTLTPP